MMGKVLFFFGRGSKSLEQPGWVSDRIFRTLFARLSYRGHGSCTAPGMSWATLLAGAHGWGRTDPQRPRVISLGREMS